MSSAVCGAVLRELLHATWHKPHQPILAAFHDHVHADEFHVLGLQAADADALDFVAAMFDEEAWRAFGEGHGVEEVDDVVFHREEHVECFGGVFAAGEELLLGAAAEDLLREDVALFFGEGVVDVDHQVPAVAGVEFDAAVGFFLNDLIFGHVEVGGLAVGLNRLCVSFGTGQACEPGLVADDASFGRAAGSEQAEDCCEAQAGGESKAVGNSGWHD